MLVVIQYGDIWAFGGCGCRGGWGRAPFGYTQNPLVTCHYLGAYRRRVSLSLWVSASCSVVMALVYCGDLCVGWAGLVCTGTAVICLLIDDIRSSCAPAPFVVAQSFGRCIAQNT